MKNELLAEISKKLEATWEAELKDECMKLIREQPNLENVNMDAITNKLMEIGKSKIPEDVKTHAYNRIKAHLEAD